MSIPNIKAILIFMLLLAVLPMPYVYYKLLKVVIFGVCLFFAYAMHHYKVSKKGMYILIGLAVLYNPIVSFHFGKEGWTIVNFLTIALLLAPRAYSGITFDRKELVEGDNKDKIEEGEG